MRRLTLTALLSLLVARGESGNDLGVARVSARSDFFAAGVESRTTGLAGTDFLPKIRTLAVASLLQGVRLAVA